MLTFERRADWPERLLLAISEHQSGQFQYGQYDCGTLYSDAVFAMTGSDPMDAFGRWTSKASALRRLAETGHASIKDYMDNHLTVIAPALARRGDVGYPADVEALSCPAVIIGSEAVSRDERGWIVLPVSMLVTAYRIG